MRALVLIAAFFASGLSPAFAQDDPRYAVSMRWMRDGSGARVGMVYEASNRTDAPLCLSVRARDDNLHGGIVAPTVVLAPRARRVRIASFFIRFAARDGHSLVQTRVEENCTPA
ncbi:MAG: hypothetical protein GC206_09775 [Alphaproteobacteria bacterium]|nr:hypothetical protein [Alphaproteobacteria bacterium]